MCLLGHGCAREYVRYTEPCANDVTAQRHCPSGGDVDVLSGWIVLHTDI